MHIAPLLALLAAPVASPPPLAPDSLGPGSPIIVAVAKTVGIDVDGRLAESAWAHAEPFGQFVQGEPVEGIPATNPTEVRVLFDQDAIYIAARMHDQNPDRIARQLTRRDEMGQYDYFDVSLSPAQDRRTGYRFRVSAGAVQGDAYLYDDVREDGSWDAVWQSAVAIDDLGWTVELRIPLSQVRFVPSERRQTWGVNFSRRRLAGNERSYFALESRTGGGRVSVFGRLDGLLLPSRPIPVELRPYVMARGRIAAAEEGDPFFSGREARGTGGIDLRAGVGGSFGLNLTLNPDFGQVEVDPAVINLSAFETFFPERRPFFVEDNQLLGFGLSGNQNGLFYSRRIGREPQVRSYSEASFVDTPTETTILGAAKIAGRTGSGFSIGALAAVTAQERGRAEVADSGIRDFVAEPRSYANVVSWQQELGGGTSQVNGTVTSLVRDLPGDGSLDHLIRGAWSAGIGFDHTWGRRTWGISGWLATSLVRGDSTALLRVQRSPNHYYQRPDDPAGRLDSAARSMSGAEWRMQFEKRGGRHWTWGLWTGSRTAGFEVNDLGWSQGSARLDIGGRLQYREIMPGTWYQSYRITANTFHNFRHDALDRPFDLGFWRDAHKAGNLSLETDLTLRSYWSLGLDLRFRPTVRSDGLTRGGPLMIDPGALSTKLEVTSDRRMGLSGRAEIEAGGGRAGSTVSTGIGLEWRPSSRVELELGPRLSWQTDRRQYVTAIDDSGYQDTFGRRYFFGDLKRQTFSLETRLNLIFTRTLSLQLFAQPLVSTGDYVGYKQLASPATFEFLTFAPGAPEPDGDGVRCIGGQSCTLDGQHYVDLTGDGVPEISFEDKDFRIRSLRGNAVLRWEYRPGSVLFLVWQQRRSYRDAEAARFEPFADLGALFGDPAEHIFSVKLSYWLGM